GQLQLENVPFDLHSTLSEIVELLRFRASAQGTGLELNIGPEVPPWVWGDPGRLRQVLTNLVGNAVKFTEGGRVSVEIRRTGDGRYRFEIKDNGIGIPIEAQRRLFSLFSQADSSTSRRYGGSGLGLAISQRIVQQMGGQIGCESLPGMGSIFWFILRLETASPPAASPSLGGGLVLPKARKHYRILVAEDNPVNQLVVTQHLASWEYDVVAVNNGREALEAFGREPFDLILMDCQMPELDGYEATRRIRAGEGAGRQVPIVALTAHAMREELDRCLAVGMNDYITKPFRKETLEQKLERWLNGTAAVPLLPLVPLLPSTEERSPAPPSSAPEVAGNGPARESPLDERKVMELRELGRELGQNMLRELAESFSAQTCLEEMDTGLKTGDLPLIKRQAHILRGSGASLGAVHLASLCAELEYLPAEAETWDYRQRIAAIGEEYQRVIVGLMAASEEM
ncbi:MAG TPA: ATP-binding protein, partial [Thermoanaerobaculia bacterium]|nr:ATP-binding protein [Thermoanaerobaculia bacterium]